MLTTEWVVDADAALLLRQWGDECVVYNSVSGDTHLLNALGAVSLTRLLQSPATANDLALRVVSQLGFEADETLLEMIEALLGDFERIGLIRQHPIQ
jgi:PqqD family protein of HPr-rel-A system